MKALIRIGKTSVLTYPLKENTWTTMYKIQFLYENGSISTKPIPNEYFEVDAQNIIFDVAILVLLLSNSSLSVEEFKCIFEKTDELTLVSTKVLNRVELITLWNSTIVELNMGSEYFIKDTV